MQRIDGLSRRQKQGYEVEFDVAVLVLAQISLIFNISTKTWCSCSFGCDRHRRAILISKLRLWGCPVYDTSCPWNGTRCVIWLVKFCDVSLYSAKPEVIMSWRTGKCMAVIPVAILFSDFTIAIAVMHCCYAVEHNYFKYGPPPYVILVQDYV